MDLHAVYAVIIKGCEKTGYNYVCYSYHHLESTNANTLFDKVKSSLQNASCIVFVQELQGILLKKVRKQIASSQKYTFSILGHIAAFIVDGKEDEKLRSK